MTTHKESSEKWVYHLSQAKSHCYNLRQNTMVKVAKAIEERNWTQTKAADFLGVNQPRISDLIRGKVEKFTLDALVEMLFALDKPVRITTEQEREWGLSNAHPATNSELEDSIEFFTNAIRLDPTDILSLSRRAGAYEQLGKYDLAIGDYTRCVELAPDQFSWRHARATTFKSAGEYKAALQDFNELEERFPEMNIYQNRGLLYMTMGDYPNALKDCSKAIALEPKRPGPHFNRALLHERMGNIEAALVDYQNTLVADPTYKTAQQRIDALSKPQAESK